MLFKHLFVLLFGIWNLVPGICINVHGQSKTGQEIGLAAQNVLFGGIVSGVGAAINKPKGQSFAKAFIRGFTWGSLGGGGLYLGKKLTYPINAQHQLLYGWPSKLVHSAGISIIENAAKNEAVFSNWHTNIGFVRLDINLNSSKKLQCKLMPFSFGEFIYGLCISKLNVEKTFLLGTPVFIADTSFFEEHIMGYSGYNVIYIPDSSNPLPKWVLAHENVHILQYNEALEINTWFHKPVQKVKRSVKSNFIKDIFTKYVYYDIPYQNIPFWLMKYPIECYYKNPLELEAQHFATNQYIKKCE